MITDIIIKFRKDIMDYCDENSCDDCPYQFCQRCPFDEAYDMAEYTGGK